MNGRRHVTLMLALLVTTACTSRESYSMVLQGGRVMDPATGMDSVRNLGVREGQIVAISSEPLRGDTVLDVRGKVVAPGFIDLHAHGQTTGDMQIQAKDGVTTARELAIGVYPVASWYASLEGKAPLNYGATVSHVGARFAVFDDIEVGHWPTNNDIITALGPSPGGANKAASQAQVDSIAPLLRAGLSEGALAFDAWARGGWNDGRNLERR